MITILRIGFWIISLIQLFAVLDFFWLYLGWHWAVAWIPAVLAIVISPLIAAICGIIAAISVWDWAWWQAVLLFFLAPVLAILAGRSVWIGGIFSKNRSS